MSAPSDRDLIQRTRRGGAEAFGELVVRYQTRVFNVWYRILHERREAEDLTQEIFLRVWDRLQTFDDERLFFPGYVPRIPNVISELAPAISFFL
jgi:RNA polymerase sigma-70 factor, ECF subfamily